jgi:signal transduction histidine kinase
MKRMTPKITITAIFVIFLTSAIPNVLWQIFGDGQRPVEVRPITILIGGIITVSISITIFSIAINRLVIKRIKKLSTATKEVMEGNYNLVLEDRQKDEINELITNFNKMVHSIERNEYINKDFARNFSHEMKTPLSAIKGYADLIRENNINAEDKEKYINIIIEESTRLSNLSKNMLLISQLDNQIIIPKQDYFNIAELLRNVIQLQQLDWEEKQIDLNLDLTDFKVTSNKELLYQVFENLMSNAIKYANPNSTIKIELKEDDGIYFKITNTGHLTNVEQENIFQLFYIKDQSRQSKSSGVGLTLTKKIIEKLEGTISVSSENQTVSFLVRL